MKSLTLKILNSAILLSLTAFCAQAQQAQINWIALQGRDQVLSQGARKAVETSLQETLRNVAVDSKTKECVQKSTETTMFVFSLEDSGISWGEQGYDIVMAGKNTKDGLTYTNSISIISYDLVHGFDDYYVLSQRCYVTK